MTRVALVGFGEVGRIVHDDLVAASHDVIAWDSAFGDPASRASANAAETCVPTASDPLSAVDRADVVICGVTAANTLAAAAASAAGLAQGAFWFDLNSSSPTQKQCAAAAVESAGGRYVEAALMSPVGPKRLGSPFLLGGPRAKEFLETGAALGLTDLTVYSDTVGTAAAAKLCRSIIVKGLESLFTESLMSARAYGVERDVLDSLPTVLPPADWERVATYFLTRTVQHGLRRSEEMTEAAATVQDAGLEPWLAEATSRRQAWAAQHSQALDADGLFAMLDALRGGPAGTGEAQP